MAASAGGLLEATLDRLTFQYRGECRATRTTPTHGKWLLAATGELFKRLQVIVRRGRNGKYNWTGPESTMNQVSSRSAVFVRNQVGAHYNPAGLDIPDGDVRELGILAVGMVEPLTCPFCGQIPKKPLENHLNCSCPPDRCGPA